MVYLLAGHRNDKTTMWVSVLGRAFAVLRFARHEKWMGVAVYEGVCGGMIGLALLWEGWRGKGSGKTSKTL